MNNAVGVKHIFITTLVLAFIHCSAQQDELQGFKGFSTPRSTHNSGLLKTNLIPFLVGQMPFTGELRLTYERAIAKKQSVTIGASYDYPNFILAAAGSGGGHGGGRRGNGGGYAGRGGGITGVSIEGGRVTLGYRYYPLKNAVALKGLFVGPYLSYNAANIREKNNSSEYEVANYANASAITGYQLVFPKHWSFEIFGGIGYKDNFSLHYDAAADRVFEQYRFFQNSAMNHIKLVVQMNFGYAF
jgi:hypothetical protein